MSFNYLESLQKRGCTLYTITHSETQPYRWTIFQHVDGDAIPIARYIKLDEALHKLKELLTTQLAPNPTKPRQHTS